MRDSHESRPFVSVSRSGQLLPEVKEVIAIAAKHGLTVETGHSSAAEGLDDRARGEASRAWQHIVVTHAMLAPVRMSVAQMREAAREGAYIEFVYNGLLGANKAAAARLCERYPRGGRGFVHSGERSGPGG